MCIYELKDYHKAKEMFDRAIEIDSLYLKAKENLKKIEDLMNKRNSTTNY